MKASKEKIFRFVLFVTGIINFLPSLLAVFPSKIGSYGIDFPNNDFELLLRHRAVLFGIIGAIMVFSAIRKKYYSLATLAGMVSMVSFLVLYFIIGDINAPLKKIMSIDLVAIILLSIGYGLLKSSSNN